ncbi:MAG TPA: hypothetical protein VG826_03760 [Pirellulales bacterium]|nr:hypothetical protein [Pirellulales bacterium]
MLTFRGGRKTIVTGAALVLAASVFQPAAGDEYRSQPKTRARAATPAIETTNFRIYGISRLPNAQAIAGDFEKSRGSLCGMWLGGRALPDWSPKCDVVIHAAAASYARAVGQDQFATIGSSRVDVRGGRITLRRLDIRADNPGWFAAAVPHELTHLVMADEFAGGEVPAWADEGMAVLADTPAKQSLHQRDFELGRRTGGVFRLAHFVSQTSYPTAAEIPVFYGQSVSLVGFLVDRRSAADFVRFLHLAEKEGYDAALRQIYGLHGVHLLEREWLASTFPRPNMLTAETAQDRDSAIVDVLVTATTP